MSRRLDDLMRWLLNDRPSLRCTLGFHDWGPSYLDVDDQFCSRCGKDHP